MCITVLTATQGCRCGATPEIKADTKPLRGIHGKYASDEGRQIFYMVVLCPSCGAVYEPDHARFAAYFNMAKDRLLK